MWFVGYTNKNVILVQFIKSCLLTIIEFVFPKIPSEENTCKDMEVL